jgi:hypothetical protein
MSIATANGNTEMSTCYWLTNWMQTLVALMPGLLLGRLLRADVLIPSFFYCRMCPMALGLTLRMNDSSCIHGQCAGLCSSYWSMG